MHSIPRKDSLSGLDSCRFETDGEISALRASGIPECSQAEHSVANIAEMKDLWDGS